MKQHLHILVLTAFLVSFIAPACGFSWGGQFSVIEICTAQGLENRVVENDTDAPEAPMMADQCQFCFASANITSFLPETAAVEALKFQADKQHFAQYEEIILSRLTGNLSARGPPALV